MGFFEKIKAGLKKTKDSLMGNIERVLNSFTKIDEEFFEELEETLIMSDLGAETSMAVCDELRKLVKEQGITSPDDIKKALKSILGKLQSGAFQCKAVPFTPHKLFLQICG